MAKSIICPECGYLYPPGTIAIPGEGILDSVVEAGGQSTHPEHCSRSERPRSPSVGSFQQQPAWGHPE